MNIPGRIHASVGIVQGRIQDFGKGVGAPSNY